MILKNLVMSLRFDKQDCFVHLIAVSSLILSCFIDTSMLKSCWYMLNSYLLKTSQIHLQAGTDAPLNVTFIRAPSNALLKVEVPLVFRGEDVSPGLKKG